MFGPLVVFGLGGVATEVLGSAVLLPLAVVSLVTGLVQSLGTQWGCSGTAG